MPADPAPVLDAAGLAAEMERRMRAAGTPARAAGTQAYLKSSLEFAGASVPEIRGIVRALVPRRARPPRGDLIALVTTLWARPVHECRMAAIMLLDDHHGCLDAGDAALVERLIRESGTWAYVDELAGSVMGRLVERFPGLAAVLDRWAGDEDFWIRRSALLSLLLPLRRGDGDFDRFARYADAMLEEREFFI